MCLGYYLYSIPNICFCGCLYFYNHMSLKIVNCPTWSGTSDQPKSHLLSAFAQEIVGPALILSCILRGCRSDDSFDEKFQSTEGLLKKRPTTFFVAGGFEPTHFSEKSARLKLGIISPILGLKIYQKK